MSSSPSAVYDNKRFIERGSHKGKGLAVFTSGGDSQGMVVLYLIIRTCNCDETIVEINWTCDNYGM
jgi:hypothetical protein